MIEKINVGAGILFVIFVCYLIATQVSAEFINAILFLGGFYVLSYIVGSIALKIWEWIK